MLHRFFTYVASMVCCVSSSESNLLDEAFRCRPNFSTSQTRILSLRHLPSSATSVPRLILRLDFHYNETSTHRRPSSFVRSPNFARDALNSLIVRRPRGKQRSFVNDDYGASPTVYIMRMCTH